MVDKIKESYGASEENPFLRYFHNRINKNKNCIIVIVGETGGGKSYSALRLGEVLDPKFDINRVAFNAEEFLRLLEKSKKELPRGSVILFDESGVAFQARNFMSLINKSLSYALQTCRFKNHIIILTVPDMKFIDSQGRRLIHMFLVASKVLIKKKRVRLRPYIISINHRTGEKYEITPRIRRGARIIKVHKIEVGLPSAKLRHAYEKIKEKYANKLYRSAIDEMSKNGEDNKKDILTERQRLVKIYDEAEVSTGKIASLLKITKRRVYAIRNEYKDKMNSV